MEIAIFTIVTQLAASTQLGAPVTRIGAVDDTLQGLHNVVRVVEDIQGRVYVLQLGATSVPVFDSTGKRLTTLGGPGGGPGNMSTPGGIGYTEDRIWIADLGLRTWHLIDAATGDYLRRLDITGERSLLAGTKNYVWLLEKDENDVQYLVKHFLR